MRIRSLIALLTALLVLVSGAVSEYSSLRQAEAAGWVAHTREVIGRLESTRAALVSAESAERAFLITGEAAVLAGFAEAQQKARAGVAAIARLTLDNASQQRQVAQLRGQVEERIAFLRQLVALRAGGDAGRAMQLVAEQGVPQMRRLEAVFSQLRQAEEQLLQARLETAERAQQAGTLANVASTLLAFALLGYLYRLWSRHAGQMARQADALALANERLQESAQMLERRVQERTTALSEANAELEAFARTVAHDLRAPVRNIQGYAQALIEDEAQRMTPEGGRFVQRLMATARRMEELITGLLEYSRLARAHLALERVELLPLVRQVLEQLQPDIDAARARVTVQDALPAVLAHRGTLLQCLENLVANAIKFVHPGQAPELSISAERRARQVVLSFADRGIGIAAEHHERIFSAFERLHGQEAFPGTGIGLAIVRRGVERMGGRVTVASTPGAGSRFEVQLEEA